MLAGQLSRWRKERSLSAQALANRLAELGSDLDRRAISKIENGSRGVSLDEWLELAHALAVPPPLLFLDFETGGDVAVAPGVALHPWLVWEWVAGEHASPMRDALGRTLVSRVEEFGRAKTEIDLYKREREATTRVEDAEQAVRSAEYVGDEDRLRAARGAYVEALRQLAETLDEMVEHGKEGMALPGKHGTRVEAIRSLGLSRHPDRLVIAPEPGGHDGSR